MLFVLINVLVIIVVGAILFYLIDRFVRDGRLANLLTKFVVLICLADPATAIAGARCRSLLGCWLQKAPAHSSGQGHRGPLPLLAPKVITSG